MKIRGYSRTLKKYMEKTAAETPAVKKDHSVKAMVPGAGIEPARLAARDFESRASTNSTTRATLSDKT